jgi:muramidase (phage lysozyme)
MDRTVPAGAALLLDFIYRTDAGKAPPLCYETIFGNRQNRLATPITKMTLGDLIDAQKNWSSKAWVKANWGYGTASSAAGAAQFMRATLIDLAKELHLLGNQVFDPDFQDRLAYHLLKRRGYDDFMAGKIGRIEFGKRLAQEWASFPVLADCQGAHRPLKRGQSYYLGDGLNSVRTTPAEVEAVLDRVKAAPGPVSGPPPLGTPIPGATVRENRTVESTTPEPSSPKACSPEANDLGTTPKRSIWAALADLITKLFGRKPS